MKQEVQNQTDDSRVADIIGTLVVLNKGRFIVECGAEFQDLTDAICATNKPGKLIITLTVSPSGWNKGTMRVNQVDVAPEFSVKKPLHDQAKSIFFVTDDNKLTRTDPDQETLFEERQSNG